MENSPYLLNGAVLNDTASNGAVLNGTAPHSVQYATVKSAPVAPAIVEPNVNVEPQTFVPTVQEEVGTPKVKKKARTRETGHGVNLRNFGRIIDAVYALADAYVNTNPLLEPEALKEAYDAADQGITMVSNKNAMESASIEVQVGEFANLKKTCTMAFRYFQTSGASKVAIAQLKGLNASIQGYRMIKPKTDDVNLNSVSHQSYAQLAIHFDGFIQFLEKEVDYNPGNDELKVVGLKAKHGHMVTKYRAVEKSRTETYNARVGRDVTMYKNTTGLVERAYAVKNVFLSLFGSRSPQYKQISGLHFTKCPDYKYL